MHKSLFFTKVACCLPLALTGLASLASADQTTFEANKCNKCHAVSAYGITRLNAAAPGAEDTAAEEGATKIPDLSNVGKFHDAAFFTSFLKKEIGHVPHPGLDNDKKHKTKFSGSDDDLKKIADWLATLKKDPS